MASIDNILSFIDKIKSSKREIEQGSGMTNGTLGKSKASGEISPENLEKFLEKYSTAVTQAGYCIVNFGPAMNHMKAILTPEEKKAIEEFAFNGTKRENMADLSRLLPMGDIKLTVKDYIDTITGHNTFLQFVIKNGLGDLKSNLATVHQELTEQIGVSTSAGLQELKEIATVLKAGIDASGDQRKGGKRGKNL